MAVLRFASLSEVVLEVARAASSARERPSSGRPRAWGSVAGAAVGPKVGRDELRARDSKARGGSTLRLVADQAIDISTPSASNRAVAEEHVVEPGLVRPFLERPGRVLLERHLIRLDSGQDLRVDPWQEAGNALRRVR